VIEIDTDYPDQD
jgi:hypothetical protein